MSEIQTLPMANADLPLARAAVHGGLVYVSGQVGFKPGTTTPIAEDVAGQAREIFRLIDEILSAAGSHKNRLVMTRIYLTQVKRDFPAMNEVYAQWLGGHRPARTTVGVELAIDGLLVEVDCIAAVGE